MNHGIDKIMVDSIQQGFLLMDKNRVEGFAGYEKPWDFALLEKGIANKYKKLPPFGENYEFMAGKKESAHIIEFIKIFDAGKKIIKDKGIMKKIIRKWKVN